MTDARTLVAEAIERPRDHVPANGTIETVEGWDSLGHMRIMLALEARLGRPMETEEILELASVEAIDRLLNGDSG